MPYYVIAINLPIRFGILNLYRVRTRTLKLFGDAVAHRSALDPQALQRLILDNLASIADQYDLINLEAIAEAHRGGAPMTSEIARKVIAAFHEPKPEPTPTEALAPREKEILELVANGYANKEIADKLAITLSTVCWYLHEIYKKLHVQSRVQAVNKLRQSSNRPPSP